MTDKQLTRQQANAQLAGLLLDFRGVEPVPFLMLAVAVEVQRLANRCCAPLLLHGQDGKTIVFKPKIRAWGKR